MDRGWHPKHLTYKETDWDDEPLEVCTRERFSAMPKCAYVPSTPPPPTTAKVILVPHSHVDPGWIKTLQAYFDDQAKHILDTIVDYLSEEPFRTFIWAEMSYLQLWWDQATADQQQALRRLALAGQFEVVTGGWVMTDEASAHVFGMVDQLIEGQLWLNRTLGVQPRTGWSIDPFGQSPTMAFLNNRAGMKGMIIDRIHWRLKQHMQRTKNLVFRWRQQWDGAGGATDIVTHTLPFYLYDVHYSCGPDYATCCHLDFGYPYFINRPAPMCQEFGAGVVVRPPGEGFEAVLADDLLREYRKMSKMYRRNVILHPVGGDFRYVNKLEIHAMLDSYTHLMRYINAHPEFHTTVRFGTLSDYFERLDARGEAATGDAGDAFAPLSGDFFPYSDRKDHHWSGFYSTRSSFKRLARQLEVTLRAAEIHATLAGADAGYRNGMGEEAVSGVFKPLSNARRALALFMHHDALTGTSKEHVMQDYESRLQSGLRDAEHVLLGAMASRLGRAWGRQVTLQTVTSLAMDQEPTLDILEPTADGPVFLAVPSALTHDGLVPLRVRIKAGVAVQVADHAGGLPPQQITPAFHADGSVKPYAELWFLARLPALGMAVYQLRLTPASSPGPASATAVWAWGGGERDSGALARLRLDGFDTSRAPPEKTAGRLVFKGAALQVQVDNASGMLQGLRRSADTAWTKVAQSFEVYGSHMGQDDHSGAYLFMPHGPAAPYVSRNGTMLRLAEGPLFSQLDIIQTHVHQRLRLFKGAGAEEKVGVVMERPWRGGCQVVGLLCSTRFSHLAPMPLATQLTPRQRQLRTNALCGSRRRSISRSSILWKRRSKSARCRRTALTTRRPSSRRRSCIKR